MKLRPRWTLVQMVAVTVVAIIILAGIVMMIVGAVLYNFIVITSGLSILGIGLWAWRSIRPVIYSEPISRPHIGGHEMR